MPVNAIDSMNSFLASFRVRGATAEAAFRETTFRIVFPALAPRPPPTMDGTQLNAPEVSSLMNVSSPASAVVWAKSAIASAPLSRMDSTSSLNLSAPTMFAAMAVSANPPSPTAAAPSIAPRTMLSVFLRNPPDSLNCLTAAAGSRSGLSALKLR